MPDGRKPAAKWLRYSSLGVELGAAVALPTLLGAWIDRKLGSEPWGLLTGFGLGITGGLYHFIRVSMIAMREASRDDRQARSDPEDQDAHDDRDPDVPQC